MQQPKQIIDGDVTYYEYADGFASAADGCGWVSALFVSVDAARSWRGHFTDAEIEFRRMNGGPQGAAYAVLPLTMRRAMSGSHPAAIR